MNPNLEIYQRYGAKGIGVCDQWRDSFEAFLADMGLAPSPLHSIDRIKNDRGYEPGNCRWATPREQAINRRRTVFLTHDGVTLCKLDWALRLGVTPGAIQYWLDKGKSFPQIVEHLSQKAALAA